MTRREFHADFQDIYEYHGNTSIELVRSLGHWGQTLKCDLNFYSQFKV